MNATVKILRDERNTKSESSPAPNCTSAMGELDGLKLIGFAVWSRQDGKHHVAFHARQFTVDGERRRFERFDIGAARHSRSGREHQSYSRRSRQPLRPPSPLHNIVVRRGLQAMRLRRRWRNFKGRSPKAK